MKNKSAIASAASRVKNAHKRRGDSPEMMADVEAQLEEAETTVANTSWEPLTTMADFHKRYSDRNVADNLPRAILYLDIGVLMGRVMELQAQLDAATRAIAQYEYDKRARDANPRQH